MNKPKRNVGDALERLDKVEQKWVKEMDEKGKAKPSTLDEMRRAENDFKKKLR